MDRFYLKNIELRNDEEFVKPAFFDEGVFVYFGYKDTQDEDEWALFDLKIISYDYLIDFVNRLDSIFIKDALLLQKYDIGVIENAVNEKFFENDEMSGFLLKEYEEYFDENWDAVEENMLEGIEQMKHSKSFVKDIKIILDLAFDKDNFNEMLKLDVIVFDGNDDLHFDYRLNVRSINNLKQENSLGAKFVNKCFFINEFNKEKIESLLNEFINQCKFNTGVEDIKNILSNSLFDCLD